MLLIGAADKIAVEALSYGSRAGFGVLLRCIEHGGVAAEMAARSLNVVLERRDPDGISSEDIIVEPDYWRQYKRAFDNRSIAGPMDRTGTR